MSSLGAWTTSRISYFKLQQLPPNSPQLLGDLISPGSPADKLLPDERSLAGLYSAVLVASQKQQAHSLLPSIARIPKTIPLFLDENQEGLQMFSYCFLYIIHSVIESVSLSVQLFTPISFSNISYYTINSQS